MSWKRKSRNNEASVVPWVRVAADRQRRARVVVRRLQRWHCCRAKGCVANGHSENDRRDQRQFEGKQQRQNIWQYLYQLSSILLPRVGVLADGAVRKSDQRLRGDQRAWRNRSRLNRRADAGRQGEAGGGHHT